MCVIHVSNIGQPAAPRPCLKSENMMHAGIRAIRAGAHLVLDEGHKGRDDHGWGLGFSDGSWYIRFRI